MSVTLAQLGLYLPAAVVFGGIIVWLVCRREMSHKLDAADGAWQARFDKASSDKDRLKIENRTLKASLEAEREVLLKHEEGAILSRTELESSRAQATTLRKQMFVATEQRNEFQNKLAKRHSALNALKAARQQLTGQQAEFTKGREFYKAQLDAALEQRKTLERKIEGAKSEHESLRSLLLSAKAEHDSVKKMLSTAQSRLAGLDEIESRMIALEAQNAQLRQEVTLAKRETTSLQRDVGERDALKRQNQELAQVLKSMEISRKQYESDARRYRDQYEVSEKQSDTLRFKLDDIEKDWAKMQQQEETERKAESEREAAMPPFGLDTPQGEIDDLTEIIGVGKVFAATLHKLGIYHFRQIAAFGPAELARVNAELKEFRGRIEHDDWIGQAKELQFRKYGEIEPV